MASSSMSLSEAQQFLEDNEIKYVLDQFVDIHGVAKTKSVPAAHLKSVVESGAGFAGFAVWGLGMEPHGPDFLARGDLSSMSIVPWQPGYARIACESETELSVLLTTASDDCELWTSKGNTT